MTLIDLITEKVVKLPLKATTKIDVFRELIQILNDAGYLKDTEAVLNAVLEREDQMSTALENGIAIPHAKTTEVSHLVLAVGISPEGIDCDSHDEQFSHLFFMLLAPPDQCGPHIEALSEIAQATRSKAFRKLLLSSENAREVVELLCEN
jgi:nitrogen PTS system EIIA component